jgi:hypothetical protein
LVSDGSSGNTPVVWDKYLHRQKTWMTNVAYVNGHIKSITVPKKYRKGDMVSKYFINSLNKQNIKKNKRRLFRRAYQINKNFKRPD